MLVINLPEVIIKKCHKFALEKLKAFINHRLFMLKKTVKINQEKEEQRIFFNGTKTF